MADPIHHTFNPKLDLKLERLVEATPEQLWAGWTKPEFVVQWFAPKPWTTKKCEIDLRRGGSFYALMQSSEGQEIPCRGCYLDLVENRRIVWTDALNEDFRPALAPFITAYILFEPHEQGTKYTSMVLHKDEAEKKRHEEMGFSEGWGKCVDQLAALFRS